MQCLKLGALKGLWESSWEPQEDPADTGILRKCALPRGHFFGNPQSLKGKTGSELALLNFWKLQARC